MPAEKQVRQIQVTVNTSGTPELKAVAAQMAELNKNSKSAAASLDLFKNAFVGYLSLQSVKQLADISDAMQLLYNRIAILTDGTTTASQTFQSLLDISDQTKSSIDSTGQTFTKLSQATRDAGGSTQVVLELTKLLTNSFRISGSSSEEAAAGVNQLTRAFLTGTIQGRELRAILRDNAALGTILEKTYGKDLFRLSREGALRTSEVYQILINNQDQINKKADALGQTFGQTLTLSFNRTKAAVLELSQQFDLSGKFATGVAFVSNNMGKLIPILEALIVDIGILATARLINLATSFGSVSKALLAFNSQLAILKAEITALLTTTNILIGVVTVIGVTFAAFHEPGDSFIDTFHRIGIALDSTTSKFLKYIGLQKAGEFFDPGKNNIAGDTELITLAKENGEREHAILLEKQLQSERDKFKKKTDDKVAFNFQESLEKLNKRSNLSPDNPNSIDQGQYVNDLDSLKIKKFNEEARTGKIDAFELKKQLDAIDLEALTRKFNAGSISFADFNKQSKDIGVAELNRQLDVGKISLEKYNLELVKLQDGINVRRSLAAGATEYINSVGTLGAQVADGIKTAFSSLETVFTDFMKNGKINFDTFTQSILDDIEKIIVRSAIVKPLAEGVQSLLPGFASGAAPTSSVASSSSGSYLGFSGAFGSTNAQGNAFVDGMIQRFATGGVVNQPTLFSHNNGQTGLMGEAGTEAILPLRRTSGGNLGVQATASPVNFTVVNNNASQVTHQESTGPSGERTITLLIESKVKDFIASGRADKTFNSNYGVSRKGQ